MTEKPTQLPSDRILEIRRILVDLSMTEYESEVKRYESVLKLMGITKADVAETQLKDPHILIAAVIKYLDEQSGLEKQHDAEQRPE
jgi:hypothetical protein